MSSSPNQIKLSRETKIVEKRLKEVSQDPKLVKNLKLDELSDLCLYASQTYRNGKAIVKDNFYDHYLVKYLEKLAPNHFLINQVEDDYENFGLQKVKLPVVMLSTQKAYEIKQIDLFLERIAKKARELKINFNTLKFRVTPKLDGFAAYFDGKQLITRGNGLRGSDISRALARGLIIYNNPKISQDLLDLNQAKVRTGAGEIVVKKSYFKQHLVNDFIHPRNFIASVIKEKTLDKITQKAVDSKAVLFIPFNELDAIYLTANQLVKISEKMESLSKQIAEKLDFENDGLVIEIASIDENHQKIKAELGSTMHHHRWQIAYKQNRQSAISTILKLIPQTGRTGKITPVAVISPIKLSGASISRVSAHNYDLVKKLAIGEGAEVQIVRSGEVIPKINQVLKPANQVFLPKTCPSCASTLIWQTKFLICPNHLNCKKQMQQKLIYFFVSLDNLDGFGPATIKIFYQNGIRKITEIYGLTNNDLAKMGFAEKTRFNLLAQLEKSKSDLLEDWRFLSAFGVERLGQAASIKLLEHYSLNKIFALEENYLIKIDGFAEKTAKAIITGLKENKAEFDALVNQFNLQISKRIKVNDTEGKLGKLEGLTLCFTGKMRANRNQMQTKARKLGAKVVSSVSAKTSYLIVGENAGESKLKKATELKIKVWTEAEYDEFLNKL